MSMRPIPMLANVETVLLPILRETYPTVSFVTSETELAKPFEQCVVVAEPQGMATQVTQYVRIRLTMRVIQADGTSLWKTARDHLKNIMTTCLTQATTSPFVDMSLESGPIRLVVDNDTCAYAILLASVTT